jgi:hypothetical protein
MDSGLIKGGMKTRARGENNAMSTQEGKERKASRREHGPQGTHVFSRDEVGKLLDEASAAEGSTTRAQLKGMSVEVKDGIYPLKGERFVIGRAETCDITLSDSSISSEHARLSREAGGWRVVNLLSTNGTFVNDKRVSNEVVQDGDRLRFGRIEFVFQNPEQQPASGAAAGHKARWMHWVPWAAAVVIIGIALIVLL